MKNPTRYSVRPRYTPGSPGEVSMEIALRVASQEKESYEAALEGVYGETDLHTAKEKGLKGIVEEMVEKKGGFEVRDLITGDMFWRGIVKPSKIQKGDRLVERRITVEQALGKSSYMGGTTYDFYTDAREYPGDRGYLSMNSNDLIKIERKIEQRRDDL